MRAPGTGGFVASRTTAFASLRREMKSDSCSSFTDSLKAVLISAISDGVCAVRSSPDWKAVRYFEVRGETLRQPIVERHYPEELKWLGRRLGPSRGVPRFILVVNGEVKWSVFGTNSYESTFLPALRQAVARRNERAHRPVPGLG